MVLDTSFYSVTEVVVVAVSIRLAWSRTVRDFGVGTETCLRDTRICGTAVLV